MSNIISFPTRPVSCRKENLVQLMGGLAQDRHRSDDVFWLKENAELLGMMASTGMKFSEAELRPYEEFYDCMEERLQFYPQYYRFFLSICLDLEDLGLDGAKGAGLCRWVAQNGLAEAELSDLQRAEACRLLARRDAVDPASLAGLSARLQEFTERAATFALPNKKAAYELTHIVYYISEYGKRDPQLNEGTLTSLEFAGVLAYLDQNYDLLAEVCTALIFAGAEVSKIWSDAVADAHAQIIPTAGPAKSPALDAYHAYLVTGWAQHAAGAASFEHSVPEGPLHFDAPMRGPSALRPLSSCLYDLGNARSGDWSGMRGRIVPYLDADSRDILQRAEASSSKFGEFFQGFARANGGQSA